MISTRFCPDSEKEPTISTLTFRTCAVTEVAHSSERKRLSFLRILQPLRFLPLYLDAAHEPEDITKPSLRRCSITLAHDQVRTDVLIRYTLCSGVVLNF